MQNTLSNAPYDMNGAAPIFWKVYVGFEFSFINLRLDILMNMLGPMWPLFVFLKPIENLHVYVSQNYNGMIYILGSVNIY